jgi:hypothetical protein
VIENTLRWTEKIEGWLVSSGDSDFSRAIVRSADRMAVPLAACPGTAPAGLAHRELMRRTKVLVAAYLDQQSALHHDERALAAVRSLLAAAAALQTASGLFAGGDNVQSPPDTAFTISDACDTYVLASRARLPGIAATLAAIARAASGALLAGGVHTPNHRWELCAALARLHRSFPEQRYVDRIRQWLGEGIDIDADGLYCERSPNYAALVSNPALLLLAKVLGRPDLRDAVERNLTATLDLLRPDGTVETVLSRRQDQNGPFSLAPYLPWYRLLAIQNRRGDFAWAARLAARGGGLDDPGLLAEAMLEPDLNQALPAEAPPPLPAERYFAAARLASRASGVAHAVVYGGSDVPRQRRVRSGLANNPTFFRLFAGGAVLDAVRLSRGFFDLGPFRAADMVRISPGRYLLTETVSAAYYQPLEPAERRGDGRYELADEGRFSAAMSFRHRPRDEVTMTTRVDAELRDDGAGLRIDIAGPRVPWSLELTFRPGGVLDGAVPLDGRRWCLPGGSLRYRAAGGEIHVEARAEAGEPLAGPADGGILRYDPGQDYTFLGGTDATAGDRVYLGGHAPQTLRLSFRAVR